MSEKKVFIKSFGNLFNSKYNICINANVDVHHNGKCILYTESIWNWPYNIMFSPSLTTISTLKTFINTEISFQLVITIKNSITHNLHTNKFDYFDCMRNWKIDPNPRRKQSQYVFIQNYLFLIKFLFFSSCIFSNWFICIWCIKFIKFFFLFRAQRFFHGQIHETQK